MPTRQKIIFVVGLSLLVLPILNFSLLAESSSEEKVIFKDTFEDPFLWKLSGIKNEKRVKRIRGQSFLISDKKYEGRSSSALSYNFTTQGEDSILITRILPGVPVTKDSTIKLSVFGNKCRQKLFLVLKEKSGESHFVDLGKIRWKEWKELTLSLTSLFIPPGVIKKPGLKPIQTTSIRHWEGNNNQFLESPLIEIAIGVSDLFDKFKGKGVIYLGELRIVEQKKE